MNKIIKGRRYDTDTATEVCENWNGCTSSDFNYVYEKLYLKRTGEFFLHYDGGAMSKYSVACGDGWCGSAGIKPLTEEQAKAFCEKYADADTYERFFEVIENGNTAISASLTNENYKKAKTYALEHKITLSELLNRLIESL